jgi:hypothetical protein
MVQYIPKYTNHKNQNMYLFLTKRKKMNAHLVFVCMVCKSVVGMYIQIYKPSSRAYKLSRDTTSWLSHKLRLCTTTTAINPNPAKCQFARNFLATFFEVSPKKGGQVAMINQPLCHTSFARQNTWQFGFLSKMKISPDQYM